MRGLAVVLALVLALPASIAGQPRTKPTRVGLLLTTSPAATQHIIAAFEDGLRQAGRGGAGVEVRWAEGDLGRIPGLAAELIRLPVDVLVTSGLPATEAAAGATRGIPIVMVNVPDPVEAKLVASLARPGGNVTGLASQITPDVRAKQFHLFKEALPRLGSVAVLRRAATADSLVWREYEAAGRAAGVKIRFVDVKDAGEFDTVLAGLARDRGTAAFVPGGDLIFFMNREALVARALAHRVPTMFTTREFTDAGGLMSYSVRLTDQFKRAAGYVDRVLKGARPGDLPIEQPTEFELVLNLRTARTLGLSLPPALLARADAVLE